VLNYSIYILKIENLKLLLFLDAMDVLKTYLETSVENDENKKRVLELQKRQESAKVSDLRRDIDLIKVRSGSSFFLIKIYRNQSKNSKYICYLA
jgi:hypothetical protein